ncbi:uncharacterized protein [Lepisosteus oculatus]|uniref:uncharacterized protein isoform X2 n=1 Tax=Lepisosteus oculatus TaxID=7918 RepID=UPI00074004BE|nr:PREDICTED: uncharacterized protein LOC107076889 isoform X2 [Lepisosteus oculatus]
MDVSRILWCTKEYTIKEFATKFKDSFPKIIKVTQGFLGRQELDSISSSTLIHVHSLYSQMRAVAEYKSGKILSMPTTFNTVTFYIKSGGKPDGPYTLQAILETFPLPVSVQPTTVLSLNTKNLQSSDQKLDSLTITQTYQEMFLLGYSISSTGTLMVQVPMVLPMYMKDVRLALAEGLEGQSQEQWDTICTAHSNLIKELGHMDHFIFQDITLLDKSALSNHGSVYAELEPIYMSIQKEGAEIALYQCLGDSTPENSSIKEKPPPLPSGPGLPPPLPQKDTEVQVPLPTTFQTLAEVPTDLHGLSVAEVCDCLQLLNLGQYAEAFQHEQVDGSFLYMLEPDMMSDVMGMKSLHIAKLLHFRVGWRPKEEAASI